MVKVGTLVLFLTLEEMLSIFHPLPSLSTRHMMRAASLCRRVE